MDTYCVKCGQANSSTNIACTNCGTRLQKPVPSFASAPPTSGSWWDNLNPAIKGAVVMFVGILLLRSLASLTKGLSCLFGFPVEIALALVQGVMVSKYAEKQGYKYQPKDYPFQAGLSAFYVYLPNLLLGILIGLISGDLLLIPLLIINFIQGIGGIALYIIMTWLSALIYVRTGGKGMFGILVGVGCVSIVVVALVIAVFVFVLASLGIQAVDYFTLAQFYSI
jgi:hypothetical protein